MAKGIHTVEVKVTKEGLILQGLGRTPKGTRYIQTALPFPGPETHGAEFKKELATLMQTMFA